MRGKALPQHILARLGGSLVKDTVPTWLPPEFALVLPFPSFARLRLAGTLFGIEYPDRKNTLPARLRA